VQILFNAGKMYFNRLRLEYALEGTSNFFSWKDIMEVVLANKGVWEYTQIDIPKPTASNEQALSQWKKDKTRARRIILEGVRDDLVSKLHGNETPFAMWKTLTNLFQSSSDAKKLELRDKLGSI